jgi:RNA polymerase sigma factor (sigma-70 family)
MKRLAIDRQTAEKILRRAKTSARKRGFGEHADDLAQEVLLSFVEGRGRHQTIDQAVIDAIRRTFGDSRSDHHQLRRACDWKGLTPRVLEIHGKSESDRGCEIGFERIVSLLGGPDRAIIKLRYQWGFREREIGDLFGLTESRISQRLKDIQTRLHWVLADEQDRAERGNLVPEISELSAQYRLEKRKQNQAAKVCQGEVDVAGVQDPRHRLEGQAWLEWVSRQFRRSEPSA